MDYPVTTPYGPVEGYPLNPIPDKPGYGFHNGIDYGYPMGTPVVVNGIPIGISNNTGATTGPHLHVGKWVNGVVEDPGVGNGFSFKSAIVYDTGEDATDGIFVRITGDGALWDYLHLEKTLVIKGQVLKGSTNMVYPNKGDLINIYNDTGWPGHLPNLNDIAYWTSGTSNANWSKGADQVQKDLLYSVATYVSQHKVNTSPVNKQIVVDYINSHLG